ncbi:MAG: WD40 repeat domain-containing protein [Chloroflexota bacterium]
MAERDGLQKADENDSYAPKLKNSQASVRQIFVATLIFSIIILAIFSSSLFDLDQSNELTADQLGIKQTATDVVPAASNPVINPVNDSRLGYQLLNEIPLNEQVQSITFSFDGTRVAVGLANGTIIVWNLNNGGSIEQVWSGHTGVVTSLAFSHQSAAQLISGSLDSSVRVWQLGFANELTILTEHTSQVFGVAASPTDSLIVSVSSDGAIYTWNTESGQRVGNLAGHSSPALSIAIDPTGQRAVSGYDDGKLLLWDLATSQLEREIIAHDGSVRAVEFFGDANQVVTGAVDGTVKLWNLGNSTGTETMAQLQFNAEVNSIAVDPSGRFIALATNTGLIQIWDQSTKAILPPLTNQTSPVQAIAYSPDGRYLVSGNVDGVVSQWQVAQ